MPGPKGHGGKDHMVHPCSSASKASINDQKNKSPGINQSRHPCSISYSRVYDVQPRTGYWGLVYSLKPVSRQEHLSEAHMKPRGRNFWQKWDRFSLKF